MAFYKTLVRLLRKFAGLPTDENMAAPIPTAIEKILSEIKDKPLPEKISRLALERQKVLQEYDKLIPPLAKAATNPYNENHEQFKLALEKFGQPVFKYLNFAFALVKEEEIVTPATDAEAKSKLKQQNQELQKKLVEVLTYFKFPGKPFMQEVETYIEEFEEPIFYEEARGHYKSLVSPNHTWIKLPLTQNISNIKKLDVGVASTAREKIFFNCPPLPYLEVIRAQDWHKTSYIDITEHVADKSLAPIYDEKSGWFLYVFNPDPPKPDKLEGLPVNDPRKILAQKVPEPKPEDGTEKNNQQSAENKQ